MKRLRIAAVVTAVALSAGLTACGGSSTPPAGTTEAPTGPVTITYLHRLPDGAGMTKVADIVKKWNDANPDIQVQTTKFDGKGPEMTNKLQTDIQANNGPCLAQLSYNEVPDMYSKGLLVDVTQYANQYKSHFGGAFGQMTVGGVTVGLPQDSGPLVYAYNATAFQSLGIKVPTTLAEFETAAATAAAQGKYIADFTADEAGFWLSAQTAAAGGTWYSTAGDQWKVTANGAASQTVATFWQTMLDAKSVLTLDRWSDAYTKAITDGQLVGNILAAWDVALILPSGDATEGQWRVAQVPDFGAGPMTGPNGGSGVAVMKGCPYAEQAMKFNDWFNNQVDDLATQGLVPASLTLAKTPATLLKQFGNQDVMAEFVKANGNLNKDFVYIPSFSAVVPDVVKTAAAVTAGTGSVAAVFDTAQTSSIAALQAANLPVAG